MTEKAQRHGPARLAFLQTAIQTDDGNCKPAHGPMVPLKHPREKLLQASKILASGKVSSLKDSVLQDCDSSRCFSLNTGASGVTPLLLLKLVPDPHSRALTHRCQRPAHCRVNAKRCHCVPPSEAFQCRSSFLHPLRLPSSIKYFPPLHTGLPGETRQERR